jgi:hypothetical protein
MTNEITIDLEAIERMPVGVIKDSETIRQLALQSMRTGDVTLLTRINPMFAFAGLYPEAMKPYSLEDLKKTAHIEYERRFLLKRVPDLKFANILEIRQYYGFGNRYRSTTTVGLFGEDGMPLPEFTRYAKEIKSSIGFGMNSETPEVPMTQKQFFNLIKPCDKMIEKTRYVWNNGKLAWEIDRFKDINLIICEVEASSEDELKNITVPPELSKYVIKEITGDKDFSNFNLAYGIES